MRTKVAVVRYKVTFLDIKLHLGEIKSELAFDFVLWGRNRHIHILYTLTT